MNQPVYSRAAAFGIRATIVATPEASRPLKIVFLEHDHPILTMSVSSESEAYDWIEAMLSGLALH